MMHSEVKHVTGSPLVSLQKRFPAIVHHAGILNDCCDKRRLLWPKKKTSGVIRLHDARRLCVCRFYLHLLQNDIYEPTAYPVGKLERKHICKTNTDFL